MDNFKNEDDLLRETLMEIIDEGIGRIGISNSIKGPPIGTLIKLRKPSSVLMMDVSNGKFKKFEDNIICVVLYSGLQKNNISAVEDAVFDKFEKNGNSRSKISFTAYSKYVTFLLLLYKEKKFVAISHNFTKDFSILSHTKS